MPPKSNATDKLAEKRALTSAVVDQQQRLSGQNRADFLLQNQVALVRRTSGQTIGHSSWTIVHWDTEVSDDPGWFTLASDTRMTVTYAGWYLLVASSAFASNATGGRNLGFFHNATDHYRGNAVQALADTYGRMFLPHFIFAAVGDYFEVEAYQDSGAPLSFGGQAAPTHEPYFSIIKII